MAPTESKSKIVARAGVRLSNAERSVASLRAAISHTGHSARQVKQMELLLAERLAEADAARREWEMLKERPDWQFAEAASRPSRDRSDGRA
jgi:hypothetical protein